MSKNIGKHILGGFQPNFARSYDTSFRYEKLNKERDENRKYEEQQKKLEAEQEAQKKKESMDIVNRLFSGGRQGQTLRGGKPYFVADDKQTQMKLATMLPASELNRLQDLKRTFAPDEDLYVERDYSKPDAVWGFNKRTNRVEKIQDGNPLYKPKRTNTATEYNASGEKIIREFYEDGSTKDIPTGFYKKHNSTGESKDSFDLDKFNKTINSFNEEDIKINKLKSEYKVLPTDEIKYEINAKNESNQATLYDLMDEESQGIINEWYTQLKQASEKTGRDFKELERTDQEKLKRKFIETISKNFDGSSEDYARKRALILYSKFKYGYVQ